MVKNIIKFLILIFISFSLTAKSSNSLLKDAKRAYSKKQLKTAVKLFKKYSAKEPSDGEPYMYRGYIYEGQKNYKKSIRMFEKAVNLNLSKDDKAKCYLKIALFYKYYQNWNAVISYGNKYLHYNPKDKSARKMVSRAYAKRGSSSNYYVSNTSVKSHKKKSYKKSSHKRKKHKKSVAKKHKKYVAKKHKPTPKRKPKPKKPSQWELSQKYYKTGNYKEADKILSSLVEKKPKNKNYLYRAGLTKLKLENYVEGIELLDAAKKQASQQDTDMLYHINLNQGTTYHKLKVLDKALSRYKTAYSYKTTVTPLKGVMEISYSLKDYYSALQSAEKILEMAKDLDAMMYRGLSYIHLDKAIKGYTALFDFEDVIVKKYDISEKIPDKYHDGIYHLGIYYSIGNLYRTALRYFKAVERTKGESINYKYYVGKAHLYLSEYEPALKNLEEAESLAEASYLLAKYYSVANNLEKTKEYLIKAGNKNDVFWKKSKSDESFKTFREDPDFITFIYTKGNAEKKKVLKSDYTETKPDVDGSYGKEETTKISQ